MRIVSLVPSLTHMVCDFGLQDQIVGATTFCVAPPDLAKKTTSVGGTKDPDLEKVRALAPTHILVNEEENKPEHIAACRAMAATLSTFPKSPADVPALLREAGAWLGVATEGEIWAQRAEHTLKRLASAERGVEKRALYLIWRDPYMVVAHDTYISRMMELLGFENVAPDTTRYPEMTVEAMKAAKPDVLLLSSEPYPFRDRDAKRLREAWGDGAPEMRKIDGQAMSWYGTMLVEAEKTLNAVRAD